MKARLCVRGGEIRGFSEFDTSAPTAARISPKAAMFVSRAMRWKIGVVDISQAFLQADLIAPSQRVVVIAPWFIPTPWKHRVGTTLDRMARPEWGWLTMRPHYGAKCAPLRWYQKLTSCFTQRQWNPCTLDPCVYRWEWQNQMEGLEVLHADDILVTGTEKGIESFRSVIDCFQHTGISFLTEDKSLTYFGLDLAMHTRDIHVQQTNYIEQKLQGVMESDLSVDRRIRIDAAMQRAVTKQMIGSLLWLTVARSDLDHRISALASSAVSAIGDFDRFRAWIGDADKIVEYVKTVQVYLRISRPISFVPAGMQDIITKLQCYCFVGASFGSLPGGKSLESYVFAIGMVRSRDGDFVANGRVLGCASEKLHRVCRSSLAAEVLALNDGRDIALRNETLLVEISSGRFFREIPEPSSGYLLQTPLGLVPSGEEVQQEMKELAMKADTEKSLPSKKHEMNLKDEPKMLSVEDSKENMDRIRGNLVQFDNKYVGMLKLLVFTDSANAYASILSGHPATSERTLRIQLSYVRDLSALCCVSFIDKDYNLADAGAKTVGGKNRLLHIAMSYSAFKFGFLGRKKVRGFMNIRKELRASPKEE